MFHFIVNPDSKSIIKKHAVEKISKFFDDRGLKYEFHYTQRRGHAEEIARELSLKAEPECVVVAVGGDGLLHEVVNGVDPLLVTVGLIPSGTGNDFATSAHIPCDILKAAEIVATGDVKKVDCIEIGGRRSINAAGCGMDVDVLERCYRGRIKGKIKYLLSLVQSVFAFKGYEVEIEINGECRKHNALFACVCNGGMIGGGIKICTEAKISDGKLDVVVVDKLGFFSLIKAFSYLMAGKLLKFKGCEHYICDEVKFRPLKKCVCQLDGELYHDLDFDAKLISGMNFIM